MSTDDTNYRFNELSRHVLERAACHLRDDPDATLTSYELNTLEHLIDMFKRA